MSSRINEDNFFDALSKIVSYRHLCFGFDGGGGGGGGAGGGGVIGIGGNLLGGFGKEGIYGDFIDEVCGRGKSGGRGGVCDTILGGDKEMGGTANGCGVCSLIKASSFLVGLRALYMVAICLNHVDDNCKKCLISMF